MFTGSTTNPDVQPLLSPSKLLIDQYDEPTQDSYRAAGGGDGESNGTLAAHNDHAPKTGSWLTTAFQGIIVLLLLILVGLLISEFIDAGDVKFDWGNAFKSALGGGLSGAAAMFIQVLTLMPLMTVMRYQYRYGTTTTKAIKTLYVGGGWTRYYQGLTAALIQTPMARFGDTAANQGILALLQSNAFTRNIPLFVQTFFASVVGVCFRVLLMPLDAIKVAMQTDGKEGIPILRARVRRYGIGSLWYGSVAAVVASFMGRYPWFGTYNYLDVHLPLPTTVLEKILRSAFIGFVAAVISDSISNSAHALKAYCQVHATRIGYLDAARAMIAVDGVRGLLGRGLKTRILVNSIRSIMFSILWKLFLDLWNERESGS